MKDKLIELPSNKKNVRIFEYSNWKAVVTEAEEFLHMCITCPAINKRPSEKQIKSAAKLIFCRDNKPLNYIQRSPFTEEVVHLWEDNDQTRKIVPLI